MLQRSFFKNFFYVIFSAVLSIGEPINYGNLNATEVRKDKSIGSRLQICLRRAQDELVTHHDSKKPDGLYRHTFNQWASGKKAICQLGTIRQLIFSFACTL